MLHTIQLFTICSNLSKGYVQQIRDFMRIPGLSAALIYRFTLFNALLKIYSSLPPGITSTNMTLYDFLLSLHELALSLFLSVLFKDLLLYIRQISFASFYMVALYLNQSPLSALILSENCLQWMKCCMCLSNSVGQHMWNTFFITLPTSPLVGY